MDFIIGLPVSNGKISIMVVVDRLLKYANFLTLMTNFTAFKVVIFFLQDICKLQGIPSSVISEIDQIFMSKFWRELFYL